MFWIAFAEKNKTIEESFVGANKIKILLYIVQTMFASILERTSRRLNMKAEKTGRQDYDKAESLSIDVRFFHRSQIALNCLLHFTKCVCLN